MGLDVYLDHYKKPFDTVQKLREEGEALYEKICEEVTKELGCEEWKDLSDAQQTKYFEETRKRIKAAGFEEYGDVSQDVISKVELDSKVYPKHMFKIGYLRSSYNGSGINNILREGIKKDLYYIFFGEKQDKSEYYVQADWKSCLVRAREVRDEFDAYLHKTGNFMVMPFFPNAFGSEEQLRKYDSPEKAMNAFQEERARRNKNKGPHDFPSYSNGIGDFFWEGLEIVAVIHGLKDLSWSKALTGRSQSLPGIYAIVRTKPSKDEDSGEMLEAFEWHQRALEIVVEMCEWVLGQDDPENYILRWSA